MPEYVRAVAEDVRGAVEHFFKASKLVAAFGLLMGRKVTRTDSGADWVEEVVVTAT
ncbi:MAG: hypothetical protein N3F67_05430 [Acidilobaceae archaeon]|nr:hypothetical protein [Acidilobaceae archaeon]